MTHGSRALEKPQRAKHAYQAGVGTSDNDDDGADLDGRTQLDGLGLLGLAGRGLGGIELVLVGLHRQIHMTKTISGLKVHRNSLD